MLKRRDEESWEDEGKREGRKKRGKAHEFACAGDTERNLKMKKKGKEEEKETKSSFVVYMYHMYICILK